ncbi:hypothetical protein AAFF_G00424370 [Aldrovandia affinis]|uniref:Uncharacterized protein n=1 Tax=Aldrovandia affinis TaxID=143900 RepID=A0AAD7T718_9TELE|nr:hypothetical protein AAFF_G00424370 [Aldrovandia affinis]
MPHWATSPLTPSAWRRKWRDVAHVQLWECGSTRCRCTAVTQRTCGIVEEVRGGGRACTTQMDSEPAGGNRAPPHWFAAHRSGYRSHSGSGRPGGLGKARVKPHPATRKRELAASSAQTLRQQQQQEWPMGRRWRSQVRELGAAAVASKPAPTPQDLQPNASRREREPVSQNPLSLGYVSHRHMG